MSDPAKDPEKPRRQVITVPAEQGQFHHHAEDAEQACLTDRPEPTCECGAYDLSWESASKSRSR